VGGGDEEARGDVIHVLIEVAGGNRLAEEDDRPQQLVAFLRGRGDQEAELVPVVGGVAARSRAG
jgi:hypothetical protein